MSTSLSPWDLSGLGMGFGLYRPRRPSYTMATQTRRQRSESYRYATRRDNVEDAEQAEDFIEDIIRRKKLEDEEDLPNCPSEGIELRTVVNHNHVDKSSNTVRTRNHLDPNFPEKDGSEPIKQISTQELDRPVEPTPCSSEQGSSIPSIILCTFKKNLVILCVSFILIFSSFRAIQNLQSSINAKSNLGIITMCCVHGTTFLTSLFTPMVINIFTAKWALCLGMLCYLMWFGGNFYPQFYTLIPTAFFAGFGQGILWTAEISYIVKLAFDSARVTKDLLEHEIFRFHGIFLACFQTTHIWGNLISSLLLSHRPSNLPSEEQMAQLRMMFPNITDEGLQTLSQASKGQCGVLYSCSQPAPSPLPFGPSPDEVPAMFEVLWKLMCAYIGLGFVGFLLILVLLDRIGARAYPDKTGYEILMHHVSQMTTHKTFPLLIPLLIFTGLQQGFMFTDFNKYYVTCAMDVQYIGYVMITMGVASILCSIVIAIGAHRLRREVVLCFGTILHIALIIGFFIWIPENQPVLFFALAAAWGLCDAIWQTQCNTLLCLTCSDEPDVAFANLRLLQSLGLCIAFGAGTFLCVAAKLYLLICALVVAIMFYVLAEYRIRHGTSSDSVFEEPT